MRLTSIALTRYGNFEAERICFDPAPGVVNLLWAPNSSGKSVLRIAVTDLLFGIHNQTPMGFRYGYSKMRVTAEIVGHDGSDTVFSRPKARGNPIEDGAGQTLDAAILNSVLKGRDRALLERLFVLDTDALRAGGKALLESGGDVASALLSAAGGIRQVRALKLRLERQRDDLAPVRKTGSRPFYQALDRFLSARARGRSETLKPDDWFRQQRDLDALDEQRRARNAEAEAASAEIARLERIRRVRPWLGQWDEATVWLDAHPDAPRLGNDMRHALDSGRTEVTTREEAARVARDNLDRAGQSADDVAVDDALLACAEDIERLVHDAGAARKAWDDLTGVQGQYDHGTARIGDLLRQLGSGVPPERAAAILPARALLTRTRQRIRDHADIDAAVRQAAMRIVSRNSERTELDRALVYLPLAMDVSTLELLVNEVRAGGDPSVVRAEAEKALTTAAAALKAALARVPGWSAGPESLAALTPPAIDLWRRLDTDVGVTRNAADAARARSDEAILACEQSRTALSALSMGGAVPDIEALRRARSHRDSGWRLIFRRAFTGTPPTAAEEQAFDSATPLPLAFERAIADADGIADVRAENSNVLARIEAARRSLAEAERHATEATERARLAAEKLHQAQRAWAQICAPLSLREDAALADVQAFLNARERVIDALERRALAAGNLNACERRQAAWAAALAKCLGQEPATLPALLAQAERTLTMAAQRQRQRNEIEAQRDRADKEVRDAEAARVAAEEMLAVWRERWRAVLADLVRPADEEPGETESVLQTLNDIETEHRATTGFAERLNGMKADLARFTASLQSTTASLPSITVPADAFLAVRELNRLLTGERARHERHRALREGLEKARADDEAASLAVAAARVKLRAVLDLIGGDTIDDALQRLALSGDRARFEGSRDSAEARLREAGDGFSIDALRAETAASLVGQDVARIEAATAAGREASKAMQQAIEAATALRQTMDRESKETGAIAAAADQQAAIASLSGTLDEALVYHTAALLLGHALDAVEKSGDLGLQRRLGTIFQSLTCGVHTRIETEMDDNGKAEFVFVQRDFPDERQSIEQLSEGTRDQFFLALRVAAIENHLTSAEPLPFIGDDVLQTFDDDRALAALRVLTELSQHTQVIVLTHHRHVVDLAARLPEGTVFQCRRETLATTA
ncbi:MAG: hypothetical protein EXR07_11825 [Acetobacteraceae bacterium]|nr:hypothetical protein [Acetobacteraceae bacterium]